MAKRKRPASQTSPRKRAKGGPSSPPPQQHPHPHGDVDYDREYKIKSILDENATQYLISWEDDEETGEKFADTWEPKGHANREAVRDWKRQKAEKKRARDRQIEHRKGQPAQSSSNSVRSTPQPNSPGPTSKPVTPARIKLKVRKVAESSSPPVQEPQFHGNGSRAELHVDNLLEIGESQHTESRSPPAQSYHQSGKGSPLFVSANSPSGSELFEQPQAVVHVPNPPSSYFTGGYEAVSSSQAAPSTAPALSNTVEQSQYVPDPVDTSETTTTSGDTSLARTTPSRQAESTSIELSESSTDKILEFQHPVGSSAFVPSATTTASTFLPKDHLTDSGTSQLPAADKERNEQETSLGVLETSSSLTSGVATRSETHIAHIGSPQDHRTPQQEDEGRGSDTVSGTIVEEPTDQPVFGGVVAARSAELVREFNQQPAVSHNDDSTPHRGDVHKQRLVSPKSGPSVDRDTQSNEDGQAGNDVELGTSSRHRSPSRHIQSSAEIEVRSEGQYRASQSNLRDTAPNSTRATTYGFQPTSAEPAVAVEALNDRVKDPGVSQSTQAEHTDVLNALDCSTQSAQSESLKSQADAAPPTTENHSQDEPYLEQIRLSPQTQITSAPDTNHVDLTSTAQNHLNPLSRFSVTPPSRNLPPVQHYPGPGPLSSSAWQSTPYPFHTQVSRPISAGTNFLQSQLSRPVSAGVGYSNSISSQLESQSQPPPQNRTQMSQLSTVVSKAASLPLNQFPVQTSSSITPVPSQSIGIGQFGDSAPRPAIASSPLPAPSVSRNMEGPQTADKSSNSLKLKLQELRARHRASRAPEQDETPTSTTVVDAEMGQKKSTHQDSVEPSASSSITPNNLSTKDVEVRSAVPARLASPLLLSGAGPRSPSAVPHLEHLPDIVHEEQTTTSRYETLLPQSREYSDNEGQSNGSLTAIGTPRGEQHNAEPETANLFTVPISMIGHQRDHYSTVVYYHKDTIDRFLEAQDPDARLVAQAQNFVERMRNIALHPDLDNAETLTQYDVEPWQQTNWDVNCSAKFRFLKELFDCLREEQLHLVIIARPGRIVDMLETFINGINVSHHRLGVPASPKEYAHTGNIRATLLGTDVQDVKPDAADLVIAMDNYVGHESPQVRALRQRNGKWAPFISLVVPRTVEHVERSVSSSLSGRARVRALVSGIFQFRDEAGRLEEGQQPPKETAIALARYLRNVGNAAQWPIVPLTVLQDLGSQTQSEIELSSNGARHARIAEKRSREPEDNGDDVANATKKARVAPLSTNPDEVEATHISDSIDKTIQSNDATTEADGSSLRLNTTERRLQDLLVDAQDRLEENVKALSNLQYRHEDQRTQLLEVTAERNNASFTAERAAARLSEQSNSMSTLRVRNAELEKQLKEANEKLLEHSVPERAEFEALRLAAVQANNEKDKLQKRLEQAQKDLEYVRGLYQNSSNSAQQLASQTTELENQVAVAQNKATGEQVKLRQMGYDAFTKNLQNEIKRLKAMVTERDAAVSFRDEEISRLKEAIRGRMGTRGTSVPRSPRVQSPAKLDARIGSRQASPVPGELRGRAGLLHPLRNG